MNVSYLGPKGTFSEIAISTYFSGDINQIPKSSIEDVFKSVEESEVDYGVVPVENSIEGSVNNTLDLFSNSKVFITGETQLVINQCLLSKETNIESINRVFGHTQSLAQCRQWIIKNLPNVELITVISNSEGALGIEQPGDACVASEIVAEYYNLNILKKNIQDYVNNTTRFLIIGNSISSQSGNDKTSLLIKPPNTDDSGSLYKLLEHFVKNDINLNRIESRPSKTKNWNYVFFIDIDGHLTDTNINKTLENLKDNNIEVKFLGSYPKLK